MSMKFSYSTLAFSDSESEDFWLLSRPEIPIRVAGEQFAATMIGLVDTGSDYCIFPKSVADRLGISLRPSTRPPANVFGGQQVELLIGNADLQLIDDVQSISWKADLNFFDFGPSTEDETVILGHVGFLEYFTATFDGQDAVLTLVQNDNLPETFLK